MGSLNPNLKYSFYIEKETPTYQNSVSTINDNLIGSSISYSNNSLQNINTISISLVYEFDFSNYKSNFETQIYNNLGENPLSFDFSAEVV